MRDRLAELRQRAAAEGDPHEDALCFDNPVFVGDDASPVSRALREAAELWRALDRLEQLSESIDRMQQTVLCCTSEESIAREKQGLSAARAAFAREAVALQPQLGALPAAPEGGTGRAGPRVRQTQLWLLLRRYRAVLAHHYAQESRYRQRLKEQIERQAELAGIDLGAEDLDRLAESLEVPRIVGRDLEELKAKQHMAAAQARHRQLLDLEAQMAELHGLFLQLEGLLAEQHGAADSVECYVLRTLDYVAQTGGEVKKAFKYQWPSRLSALLTAVLSLCACCACLPCLGGTLR
ncbi:syntaxin-1B-like [Gymnogyps californianus]|uniref:syntaxin-1B-like n=1 Tax=Gymnogyps californianus TaxID=33616 RepID=UPI0021C9FB1E|nr:syntaxin-1B-like [Gymnogyps californianus]